jgi:hypothetical protein
VHRGGGLISLSAKERRTRWPRPIRGCTVYDALFVALAETKSEERPALVSSDERLMRSLEGTSYAGLVPALSKVGELLLFRVAP